MSKFSIKLFMLIVLILISAQAMASSYKAVYIDDYSRPSGINNRGEVALEYYNPDDPVYGYYAGTFRQSIKKISKLDTTIGIDINNLGVVAGSYVDPDYSIRATIWKGKQMTILSDALGSSTCAINDNGWVVGNVWNPETGVLPAVWIPGKQGYEEVCADITSNGGTAFDINSKNQIIGSYELADGQGKAFLWEDGQIIELGNGAFRTEGSAINDNGDMVGNYYLNGSSYACWLFKDGSYQIFNMPVIQSWAIDVNNAGTVCCEVVTANDFTAAIWEDDEMKLLNDLLPGWSFEEVTSINDLGQIVASGTDPDGKTGWWVLTPQ